MTLFIATRCGVDGPGRLSKYVEVCQIYTYQHILIRDDISLTDTACDISRPSYFNCIDIILSYWYCSRWWLIIMTIRCHQQIDFFTLDYGDKVGFQCQSDLDQVGEQLKNTSHFQQLWLFDSDMTLLRNVWLAVETSRIICPESAHATTRFHILTFVNRVFHWWESLIFPRAYPS